MTKMTGKMRSMGGQSVIEIIIALAVFSLISSALTTLIIGSFSTYSRSEEIAVADNLADEAIEAVMAVKERNWNELSMAEAVIDQSSGHWALMESPGELIADRFQRTINFLPAYRDGAGNLVSATATEAIIDPNSKWVKAKVEWTADNNSILTTERNLLLTFWNYSEWMQNDWAGGPGQAVWSETNRYDSQASDMDISIPNSISLLGASSSFPLVGEFVSSAFDTGGPSNFTDISVKTESPLECGSACYIKVMIRTAATEAGLADATWRGPGGTNDDNDFYASSTGMQISPLHNGDSWMMYKAIFYTNALSSPTLKEVAISYKNK